MEGSEFPSGLQPSRVAGAESNMGQPPPSSHPNNGVGASPSFTTNTEPSWGFSHYNSSNETLPMHDPQSQSVLQATSPHGSTTLPIHRGPHDFGTRRLPRPVTNSDRATPELSRPPSSASGASHFDMAPPQLGSSQLGKRRRGDATFDMMSSGLPVHVSKRATPDPAAQKAPDMSRESSNSSLSFEMDDAEARVFADIIGYDPRTDKKRFRMEQERAMDSFLIPEAEDLGRLQQEREDEEFARRLQQELDGELSAFTQLAPSQQTRDTIKPQPFQSFLDATGKVQQPKQESSTPTDRPRPAVPKPDGQLEKGGIGSAINLDDDDDVEIIDPLSFRPNPRPSNPSNMVYSNGMMPQPSFRNPSELLSQTEASSRPQLFTANTGPTQIDMTGTHPGMRNNLYQNDPFMPSLNHGFATNMEQLSQPGPLASTADISDHEVADFGRAPRPYGLQFNSNVFDVYNREITTFPGSQYSPLTRSTMPWEVEGEEDVYGSYGLGNYGNSEESAEALKDLLNNIQDDDTNLGAGEEERDGTPEGMADTANLYKYQQKGLAWLTKQEEGTNKGGILADDMGLGKTIQAIALMVSRRSSNPGRKTNLIIAPVALIRQWESEIASKVRRSHALSVLVYHGSGKSSKTWESIRQHDVVITTYGTLAADHKKKMELAKRKKGNPAYQPRAEDKPVLTGDDCLYYRCILDEAQNIKNKSAKTSIAAYEIKAEHRLCMTGTPMMNDVIELYSLIHFLRIQPYCQWERFNIDFARPLKRGVSYGRERAMRKLQALCKAIMLRRTKKSQMDGKPLVVLPERNTESVHAVFDEDEMAFYKALEAQSQLTFNKYLKAGTVGRNYSNMLTLLLRLRQACCHPHLLRDFAITIDVPPEALIENARGLSQEVIDRIIENGISDCPVCMDTADNYTIFNPCGHSTCPECFCSLSDVNKNPNATHGESGPSRAKFSCPNCRTEVDPIKATDYIHFKRLYEPAKAAAEGLEEIDVSEDSDSDSSSSDSTDSEDDETESLDGFIVGDDESGEVADGGSQSEDGDDLDNVKPAKTAAPSNGGQVERRGDMSDNATRSDSRPRAEKKQTEEGGDDFDVDRDLDDISIIMNSQPRQSNEEKKIEKKKKRGVRDAKRDLSKRKAPKNAKQQESDNDSADFTPGYKDGTNPFEKANGKKAQKNKGKRKRKANKAGTRKTLAQLKKEGMKNAKSREKYFARLSKDFIPSAKVSKCMEIMQQILDNPDGEKVIVFSQFTSLLDLVEIPMHRQRWRYKRFDGSMDAVSRNRSVTEFTTDPRTRILLVSLKAGNAGLNLTAASQVIILDPFWNPYIEEQAIDRAHRIGQRRAVQVHRILIQDTVEDRILSLQEKKRELIEGALDEGASANIGRLGVRELGFLFGITQ